MNFVKMKGELKKKQIQSDSFREETITNYDKMRHWEGGRWGQWKGLFGLDV